MINRDLLIGKLSPFLNKREILVDNQETVDIIDALINNHYKYAKEYDKIFRYFDGGNVEETAYNVWVFLKDNFKYTIEPEEMQLLRSPAAIIASNLVGIDCKGYATFANGVMDAYRRNTGKDFEIFYRFASYDAFDSTPQHVFSVVKEKNKEYWIDPVLDKFDEKKQPYYFKDKKIKIMALVAMSGIPSVMGADGSSTTSPKWWEVLINKTPDIIKSIPQSGGGTGYNPQYPTGGYGQGPIQNQQTSSGISTTTILLVAGAGLAAYLLLKKK